MLPIHPLVLEGEHPRVREHAQVAGDGGNEAGCRKVGKEGDLPSI